MSRSGADALLPLLRVALLVSLAAALICLGLAVAFPWGGDRWVHVLVGVAVVTMNGCAYVFRRRLLELQWRLGWPAAAFGVLGGILVLVDGGQHTPYLAAMYVGVGLAAAAGQPVWSLVSAASVIGCYLCDLVIGGHDVTNTVVVVNAMTPFAITVVASTAQWWFARFVVDREGRWAPLDDIDVLLAARGVRALPRPPDASGQAGQADSGRRGSFRLPRAPGPGVSVRTFAERIALLDDDQRRILALAGRGFRRVDIATAMHLSESRIGVRRARALELTGARSLEQLVGMYRHVENRLQADHIDD